MDLSRFSQVWLLDFEYSQPAGERPEPHCMVGLELSSGTLLRLGPEDLRRLDRAPFPTGPDTLTVAY
jgi:hypothetical protein